MASIFREICCFVTKNVENALQVGKKKVSQIIRETVSPVFVGEPPKGESFFVVGRIF
ncbi:MAG TPA: hypothetical protein VIK77_01980 [Tissierellaceae bacterium]